MLPSLSQANIRNGPIIYGIHRANVFLCHPLAIKPPNSSYVCLRHFRTCVALATGRTQSDFVRMLEVLCSCAPLQIFHRVILLIAVLVVHFSQSSFIRYKRFSDFPMDINKFLPPPRLQCYEHVSIPIFTKIQKASAMSAASVLRIAPYSTVLRDRIQFLKSWYIFHTFWPMTDVRLVSGHPSSATRLVSYNSNMVV